jgi:hypothetical protein
MYNLEEIKRNWQGGAAPASSDWLDKVTLQIILKKRVNRQMNTSMKYFWASLTYQILVFGMLGHIIIRYWGEPNLLFPAIFCLLLYVPFTIVLMREFKRMAILKPDNQLASALSIKEYVFEQYRLLTGFYRFKIRYECVLVPLSSAVLVWIIFKLYVPGGFLAYPMAAILLYTTVLGASISAIVAENKRNFKKPITQLEAIIKDIGVS